MVALDDKWVVFSICVFGESLEVTLKACLWFIYFLTTCDSKPFFFEVQDEIWNVPPSQAIFVNQNYKANNGEK